MQNPRMITMVTRPVVIRTPAHARSVYQALSPPPLEGPKEEATATIDFSLIQARLAIESKGGRGTSPWVVDRSRIKWAWLRSLALYDRSFALKRGIKLARLSFTAV